MTGVHSPWPLFCNDLDQAQQWVSNQLARSPTDQKLGHQALSLGLSHAVRHLLNQSDLDLEDVTQRQWKFRLARLSGSKNPYAELIPPDVKNFTDLQIDHARRMGVLLRALSHDVSRRDHIPALLHLYGHRSRGAVQLGLTGPQHQGQACSVLVLYYTDTTSLAYCAPTSS